MGRKLMRVPMDFDWPKKKTWNGYINPYYKECPDCENGYTSAGIFLDRICWQLVTAAEEGAREDKKRHPWLEQGIYRSLGSPKPFDNDIVEFVAKLSGKDPKEFGDSLRTLWGAERIWIWSLHKNITKLAGLDKEFFTCKTCGGDAIHPGIKEKYESWKEYDPPKGEGYQLWTTTNEGEPMSPVFRTLEDLCEWAENNATTFADHRATKEKWKEMLLEGLVYHQDGNMIWT